MIQLLSEIYDRVDVSRKAKCIVLFLFTTNLTIRILIVNIYKVDKPTTQTNKEY